MSAKHFPEHFTQWVFMHLNQLFPPIKINLCASVDHVEPVKWGKNSPQFNELSHIREQRKFNFDR